MAYSSQHAGSFERIDLLGWHLLGLGSRSSSIAIGFLDMRFPIGLPVSLNTCHGRKLTHDMCETTFLTHLTSTRLGEEFADGSVLFADRCWNGFGCGFDALIIFT